MKIEQQDYYIVITPAEGMLLTDGEIVADGAVYAPIGSDTEKWNEINPQDYEEELQ